MAFSTLAQSAVLNAAQLTLIFATPPRTRSRTKIPSSVRPVPIPALAQGTVIPPNRRFLAMLGDQTGGTNVEAPLSTIKQAVAETLAGWQGGDGQPINIYIGEELLDSVIANSQNRRALRSGGR